MPSVRKASRMGPVGGKGTRRTRFMPAMGSKTLKERTVKRSPESDFDICWEELYTIDGMPYYRNSKTEEVTYNKPDFLKSDEELEETGKGYSWVSRLVC